jgi:hypothetical protein
LQNRAREEEKSKQKDGTQEWTKHKAIEKFSNIGSIVEVTIVSLSKDQPRYYVNMRRIPIIITIHLITWLRIWNNLHWMKL